MSERSPEVRTRAMLAACLVTSFVGAAAGFAVQPMIARQLLPSLGGTAAVWNTTVLFFQLVLLLGYLFSHLTATHVASRYQGPVQLSLVVLGLAVLPLRLRLLDSDAHGTVLVWIILTLAFSVGLPYLALTTTSPFVQYAFSRSGHKRAFDPYFLYVASNVGSLVGLIAYPFLIEANMGLAAQRRLWTFVYLLFLVSVAGLVWLDRRSVHAAANGGGSAGLNAVTDTGGGGVDGHGAVDVPAAVVEATPSPEAPSFRLWLRWIALAVVPASVSLGATSYLTTDVAPVPLIWVLCLSLYLVSFIVAFGRRSVPLAVRNALAAASVGAAVVTTFVDVDSVKITAAVHLLTVFTVGLAFHGRLADLRPHPSHLTGFYVALSIGGILGTLFNAFVAPVMFDRQIEYPVALAVAVLCLPAAARWSRVRSLGVVAAPFVGYAVVALVRRHEVGSQRLMIAAAVLAAIAALLRQTPMACALVVAFAVMGFRDATAGSILFRRSFYGAIHVDDVDGVRQLVHGTTTHGYQFIDPARRSVPTAYYARSGPLGRVIDTVIRPDTGSARSLGVVGLGTGTVSTYLGPEDHLTYYEIDQEVVDVATTSGLFTFIDEQPGTVEVVLGDGRKSLEKSAETFDLLVIDAFSSDAIPTHLLTAEAVEMYRRRLRPGGVLAVHISNRYLDLEPVVGAIADRAGLASVTGSYVPTEEQEQVEFATASDWVFLAETAATLDPLEPLDGFGPTRRKNSVRAWTDDRVDITAVLQL